MIKNALIYLSESEEIKKLNAESLSGVLKDHLCGKCGPHDPIVDGFTAPVEGSELAIDVGDGFIAVMYQRNERLLPDKVVNQEVRERVKKVEEKENRRVSRKERAGIKDDVVFELLPKAFTVTSTNLAVIDTKENRLIIAAGSASRAEDVVSALRNALGSLPVSPIGSHISIGLTMSAWVDGRFESPPTGVRLGDRCQLVEPVEGHSSARFTNLPIDGEEIRPHIESDWEVVRAGLIWRDEVEFDLTEAVEFKGIKMLDVLEQKLEEQELETHLQEFIGTLFILCQTLFREFLDTVVSLKGDENGN